MKTALMVDNLSFGYGFNAVLDKVNLQVQEGALSVILGKNGSGKSTLLHLVAGFIHHTTGRIEIFGSEINSLKPAKRASLIGFLGQKHKPAFPFTVHDVVLTGRAGHVRFLPGRNDEAHTARALERTGILAMKDRIYTELSGGEQQLVMIARSLAQEPKLLLLDEPVSHLDYANQLAMMMMFTKLKNEGMTVVAVLHDPNLAIRFGDEIAFVQHHTIVRENGKQPWESECLKRLCDHRITLLPCDGKAYVIPHTGDGV